MRSYALSLQFSRGPSRYALGVVGALAALAPAGASAAPTTPIDVTGPQTCTLSSTGGSGAGRPLSVPARIQFTVPQTLRRGDALDLAARKITLALSPEARTALRTYPPSAGSGYQVTLSASTTAFGLTGVKRGFGPSFGSGPSWPLGSEPETATIEPWRAEPFDVTGETVVVTYPGITFSVGYQRTDYIIPSTLACKPEAPTTLVTLPVVDEQGTPSVQALSDVQAPVAGGGEVRIQGRNFIGADAVSFGGVAATSFEVVSDDVIRAVVPAHAASDGVQVRVARGGEASDDTALDDFDFVAPVTAGRFDVAIPHTCVTKPDTASTGLGFDSTLRLRGSVPTFVDPGAPVPVTGLRASVLLSGAVTQDLSRAGDPTEKRYWKSQFYGLTAAVAGATPAVAPLGGALLGEEPQLVPGEPAALRAADLYWNGARPPVTATAAAGGAVEFSAPAFNFILWPSYGGGTGAASTSVICTAAAGASSVIAKVPVGLPPVEQGPVVTKVAGAAYAGVGGVVAVTGVRFGSGTVKIGGRSAPRFATLGSTVWVIAPRLSAGTYDVTVTTPKGTSPVTAASKITYRLLL